MKKIELIGLIINGGFGKTNLKLNGLIKYMKS